MTARALNGHLVAFYCMLWQKRYVFIQRSIQSVRSLKALYTLPPGKPVHSGTNSVSASLGSIPAMHQLRAMTNHSHFHHCLEPGTNLYSWVDWGIMERPKMPKLQKVSKGRIQTRAVSIVSTAFYHWPTSGEHGSLVKITFYLVTLQIQVIISTRSPEINISSTSPTTS